MNLSTVMIMLLPSIMPMIMLIIMQQSHKNHAQIVQSHANIINNHTQLIQ